MKEPESEENEVSPEVSEPSEPPKRMIGTIIHLAEEKGWGFIITPEIKFTRVFFHWTALMTDGPNFTTLRKGMKVEFSPEFVEEKQNWRAKKVKVLDNE